MQSIQLVYGFQQGQETIQDIAGNPNSVCLQGLQSATNYRVQATLFNDGVQLAQSNTESFRTLAAGEITLTLHNITRQGYDYIVHYIYTSTYALSNAILSTNGGQVFQGTIANGTITFTVSGLTAGEAYLYSVQAEDIYQERETVTGSIQTTVIDQVNIYYDSRTENSVTFSLAYLHDHTFRGGWIDVWNSTDDPSTDNPISSDIWFDGDTQVTATGLTYETEYKFRAGMTVEDGLGNQTTVYSSVVTATTADHDYSNDYFTIKNEYNGENTVKLYHTFNSASNRASVEYSVNGGTTWISKSAENSGATITTLAAGESVLIRRTYNQTQNFSRITFNCTQPYSAMGNMASLFVGSWYLNNTYNLRDYWFEGLFHSGAYVAAYIANDVGTQNLIDAGRMNFGNFSSSVPKYAMYGMFVGCAALANAPDLRWAETVGEHSMAYMFAGCTSLATPPSLNASTLGESCFGYMFQNCTALTSAPLLPATVVNVGSYSKMFYGCSSLARVPDLSKVTEVGKAGMQEMFSDCIALKTGADLRKIKTCDTESFRIMYVRCRGLQIAYAPTIDFANAPTNATYNWLSDVSASGTLYADRTISSTIPTNDTSGCPSGWSVVTT